MFRTVMILTLFAVCILSCKNKGQKTSTVIFHIKYGYNKKFTLETIPFKDEKITVVDSGISKKDYDALEFSIHSSEERLFRIYAEEVNMSIQFINDAPVINIYANYADVNSYTIKNSPASTSLSAFGRRQDSIAASGREISREIDSLKALRNKGSAIDSLNNLLQKRLDFFFQQYKNFEDTVASPAAFIAMYNNIDFGNDFKALKKFIIKAGERFPEYAAIQKLKDETLAYTKIFEEEFNVGDTLPFITLPDQDNKLFSTASLKGKYYLIDFWSGWCHSCLLYFPEKYKATEIFPADKFQLISVAIDNEKNNWLKIINHPRPGWRQLIDTNMWQGETVKQLKFDSIPFNFLVSPEGKILHKAITQDSLIFFISKYVKPGK